MRRCAFVAAFTTQIWACYDGGLCDSSGAPTKTGEIVRWSARLPDGTTVGGCARSDWFGRLGTTPNAVHANQIRVRAAVGSEVALIVDEPQVTKAEDRCAGTKIPTDDAGWCSPDNIRGQTSVGTYACAVAATTSEPAVVLSAEQLAEGSVRAGSVELRIRVLGAGVLHLTYDKACATWWTRELPVWGAVTIEVP